MCIIIIEKFYLWRLRRFFFHFGGFHRKSGMLRFFLHLFHGDLKVQLQTPSYLDTCLYGPRSLYVALCSHALLSIVLFSSPLYAINSSKTIVNFQKRRSSFKIINYHIHRMRVSFFVFYKNSCIK